MAGLPDIIVCAEGLFIGLEVKNPESRENTSLRQKYVQQKIKDAGGYAGVVTNSEEAVRAVHAVLRRHARTR